MFKSTRALFVSPILALALIQALAACSRGGTVSPGVTPAAPVDSGFGHDHKIDQPKTSSCEDVITQKKIEAFMASNTIAALGGIMGHGSVQCEYKSRTERDGTVVIKKVVGFAYLTAVPVTQLTNKVEIKDADAGNFRYVEIEVQPTALAASDLQLIAQAFADHDGQAPDVSITQNTWPTVVLGSLPKTRSRLESAPTTSSKSRSVLKIAIPPNLSDAFQLAVTAYQSGQTALTIYTEADISTATILKGTFTANSNVRLNDFKRVPSYSYLSDMWNRISALGSAGLEDKVLPYSWMHEAVSLWPSLKLQPDEARKEWAGAWSIVNGLWNPRSNRTTEIGIDNSLEALRFLTLIDPTSPAAAYGAKIAELSPFIYNTQNLFDEAVYLVESKPFTPAQEDIVILLARRLLASHRAGNSWTLAKDIAKRAQFSQDTIDLVFDITQWLDANGEKNSFDKSQLWILNDGVNRDRFEQLKDLFAFLTPTKAYQPLQKAIRIVIEKKYSRPKTEAFKKAVTFLLPTQSIYRVLDKAEKYTSRLTPDQVDLLIDSAKWLSAMTSPSIAVDKAEHYLFDSHMTLDIFNSLKALYAKYVAAGNRNALSRAERELGLS
jgi:hypothetical protein